MKVADEYRNFHVDVSEFGVTAYRVKVDSGIAVIQECVHVTNDLHIILSFESSPIPFPDYISTGIPTFRYTTVCYTTLRY